MLTGKNIFFTGFMGSGKTTVGSKLAASMKRNFFDLDDYIERKEKTSISEIFRSSGEQNFRDLEARYLKQLISEVNQGVISLGGGTVCFGENLQVVRSNGLLVYIKMDPAALAARLKQSGRARPLLEKTAPEDLVKKIDSMLVNREAFYNKADLIVNGLDLQISTLKDQILVLTQKNTA